MTKNKLILLIAVLYLPITVDSLRSDTVKNQESLTFQMEGIDGVEMPAISFDTNNLEETAQTTCQATPGGTRFEIILDSPWNPPTPEDIQTSQPIHMVLAPLSSVAPGQPYTPISRIRDGEPPATPLVPEEPKEPEQPAIVPEPSTVYILLFAAMIALLVVNVLRYRNQRRMDEIFLKINELRSNRIPNELRTETE